MRTRPLRIARATGPAVFAALLLTGCSSGTGKLVPVQGKVTVAGQPLTKGSVSLRPDKARGETITAEPYGTIGPDGTYTLSTDGKPGAPVGKYVVLVVATEDPDPNSSATPKSLIHPKYADPDTIHLQVEVVENPRPGQYDLDLQK